VKLVVGRRRQRKSNGSTTPLSMRIGDLRSAPTPHQGQEGKDIVVLDRWAEDRTEGTVSSLAPRTSFCPQVGYGFCPGL
jgi:hypothetical protein